MLGVGAGRFGADGTGLCGVGVKLGVVGVPTLVVTARNDPFLPYAALARVPRDNPGVRRVFPRQGGHVPRRLVPGDFVWIAPHRRHRVSWTATDRATVWLAVHIDARPAG